MKYIYLLCFLGTVVFHVVAQKVETSNAKPVQTGPAQQTDTSKGKPIQTGSAQAEISKAKSIHIGSAQQAETSNAIIIQRGSAQQAETFNARPIQTGFAQQAQIFNAMPIQTGFAPQAQTFNARPIQTGFQQAQTSNARPIQTGFAQFSNGRSFHTGSAYPQYYNLGTTEDGQEGYYATGGGEGAFPWWGGAGQGLQYADGGVRMGVGQGLGSGSSYMFNQRLRSGTRDQFTTQPYGPESPYPPGHGPAGMGSAQGFPVGGAGNSHFGTGSFSYPGVGSSLSTIGGTYPQYIIGQPVGMTPTFGMNNLLMF